LSLLFYFPADCLSASRAGVGTPPTYFRPHNRHPRYHNLYFVGASTHPGTDLPTALVSARLVSTRILDDLSSEL